MPSSAKNRIDESGLFIVFEGGEGTGKTTQVKELSAKLKSLNLEVLLTFEPGGTSLGQKIRELLLDPTNKTLNSKAEALLLAASRAQHVEEVIKPALSDGNIVLCDRYWDASMAYQGVARGLGMQSILDLNLWATGGLAPDHVYVFDLAAEKGLERAKERAKGQILDRLEQEPQNFHELVRAGYKEVLNQNPHNHTLVDANSNVGDISIRLWEHLQSLLKAKHLIK